MSASKPGAGLVGVGLAACAACCAGPILGFLAAFGLGTVLGVVVFGLTGLAVALLAVAAILRRRRPRASCAPAEPVPVALGRSAE